MRKIRWGILGCGKIAHKFASDLKLVDQAEFYAVGSLNKERAEAFGNTYGFQKCFSSYQDLVSSDVDVIYVATPHGFHYDHVKLCLENGKAVLCEKAFTLNARQLEQLISLASAKKVFMMEAFWTKFLPHFKHAMNLVKEGRIGEVRTVTADFGFKSPVPTPQRLYDPLLGGGSLLDVGIYPVFLTLEVLGVPNTIASSMNAYDTGVDEQISMSLGYSSGAVASLYSSFAVDTPVEATICGTKGIIRFSSRFHNPSSEVTFLPEGLPPEKILVPKESGFGYQYEARHVQECLKAGLTQSPELPLSSSLTLMKILDRIRQSCGIRYSVD